MSTREEIYKNLPNLDTKLITPQKIDFLLSRINKHPISYFPPKKDTFEGPICETTICLNCSTAFDISHDCKSYSVITSTESSEPHCGDCATYLAMHHEKHLELVRQLKEFL